MGTRIKTFDSTGTAPNGRLYAGDLNAMQDQYADQSNLGQTIGVANVQIGETGLQLLRFGSGEARISGALRTDGILRGLGGLFAGTFTTTQRNAISSPPFGLIVLNTTTNQFEWNAGTPSVPNWQPIAPVSGQTGTSGIADGAVTSLKIADGTIALVDISAALRPSQSAAASDEALRALGTTASTAAAGNDNRLAPPGQIAMYGGSSAPSGWLLCDGSAVSRTTYAALFTAIAVAYGAGDGSTTFNLPDLRGRMPVGLGTHADVNTLGLSDGIAVGSRRPKHKTSITDPGHFHLLQGNAAAGQGGAGPSLQSASFNPVASIDRTQSQTTGITAGPQTGSEPTDTPAYVTVNFIIRT